MRPDLAAIPSSRLEQDPIRAFVRVAGRMRRLSFEEALVGRAAPAPGTYRPVDAAKLERALEAARADRRRGLADLDAVPDRAPVAPEDGSADVQAMHMSFGAADTSLERFIEQMADIGRVEGFRVVVRTHPELLSDLSRAVPRTERRNLSFVASPHFGDIWTEDAGEMREDRSVMVAHQPPAGFDVAATIFDARMRRLHPRSDPGLWRTQAERFPDVRFSNLGASYLPDRDTQRGMAAVALSSGAPLDVAFSAIEGGNALVGRRADGRPYVLVGRDSVALTRALLAAELRRPVEEELVRRAVAKDYGARPADVVFVEQPADYHLDVKIMLIAPGEVVVNDARLVAEKVEEWSRADHEHARPQRPSSTRPAIQARFKERLALWKELGQGLEHQLADLAKRAEREARMEARAVADLEAAGLKVHRMAGKFPHSPVGLMNFLNVEQGRGNDGGRFLIALGGDRRAEAYAQECYRRFSGERVDRIYFLDRALTPGTLQAGGGICCRSKIEVGPAR